MSAGHELHTERQGQNLLVLSPPSSLFFFLLPSLPIPLPPLLPFLFLFGIAPRGHS